MHARDDANRSNSDMKQLLNVLDFVKKHQQHLSFYDMQVRNRPDVGKLLEIQEACHPADDSGTLFGTAPDSPSPKVVKRRLSKRVNSVMGFSHREKNKRGGPYIMTNKSINFQVESSTGLGDGSLLKMGKLF